ncbi:MAG: roadblock/LC7 domain-containing protein [Deltaproteobacteria bacterium]|nr:roadblock/LC7 domain-containing protein [Deltaproteobacteria bacterium]
MQTIMLGLKSVPGVMGSMLTDAQGNVLAHSFPAVFDQGTLKEVAAMINDNSLGLQEATGEVKLFDIRTELGRIIVKTLPRMFITVLCEPAVNLQLLMISLNVAIKKLEKFTDEQMEALVPKIVAPEPTPAPAAVKPAEPVKKHWLERMQDGIESKVK